MIDLPTVRALIERAREDTLDGLDARERLVTVAGELCREIERLRPPTTGEERRALLLDEIRNTGGQWTGLRAARFWDAKFHTNITPERGVQHLLRLKEAGHLVIANPPRGRTFILAGDLQEPPCTEWANRLERGGVSEIAPVGPAHEGGGERLARHRMQFDWYTALLKRTVAYGPWVEVAAEREAKDA